MRSRNTPLVLLAAAIGLSACSSQESALVKPVGVGQPQHPAEIVQQSSTALPNRPPQVSPLRRRVVSLLEKKQYRQAIELMSGKGREGLEKEYVLALNGLLGVGDDAFFLGDYPAAAYSFKTVLDAYLSDPVFKGRISHDPHYIRSCLESCANRMMEQGLEEYRRGRLENAITRWKGVLAISPGRQEARKALDTATIQLQALQSLKIR